MQLLVTGAAGFIGSNFVRNTLTGRYPALAGAHVTVLDKLTYAGNLANLDQVADSPQFTFVQGDILDADLTSELTRNVDAVVHFAAESHVDRSILSATEFAVTNAVGTQSLLEAARRNNVGRFLHVSTDEVYGSISHGSWPETDPLCPNSPYAASKASSDLFAQAYAKTYGMDVVITRCSNNYGPYQFPEKVIPLFVTNLLDGGKVPLYGNGENSRDWLHVDDHCYGISLVLTKGRAGQTYNIGGGTELTNKELTELILQACGADWASVEYVPDRLGHDLRYSVNIDKISEELDYSPQVDFEAGLHQTIAWYRTMRSWWEPLKTRAAL